MYARTKTFTNKDGSRRTYLQIVHGVRKDGKVQQTVVAYLGRLEEMQEGSLDRLVESLAKFSKKQWVQAEAQKLMVKSAREWSLDLIFRNIWDQLGLDRIPKRHFSKAKTFCELSEAVCAMVLNRISDPLSKRAANEWLTEVYRPAFSKLEPHHLYRSLDLLAEHKDDIEPKLFERSWSLFALQVDMLFWDTTSTYFGGDGSSELGRFGHSKDSRPDRKQVMIGVVMTRAGIPIAHEVFLGNTANVSNFKEIIYKVRKRFSLAGSFSSAPGHCQQAYTGRARQRRNRVYRRYAP